MSRGTAAVVGRHAISSLLQRSLAASALTLLAACGGGGGGGSPTPPPPPPPPPTPDVLAVNGAVTSQSASAQTLLAFRASLLSSVTYPVTMNFTITGGVGGSACGAGIDYLVAPAANVSATPGASTAGVLTLGSASAQRSVTVMVCPATGNADRPLTFRWNDGAANGTATGLIRAAATLALSKPVNDTGVTTCSNASANGLACPQAGFAGQDGDTGRDANPAVVGQGSTRIPAVQLASLSAAACIQDNVTGLVWEAKTTGGLHDSAATYSWKSALANGGSAGTAGAGVCTGSTCDTDSFVAAVNAERLCGFDDWRLPLADELSGIVDSGASAAPTIFAAFTGQQAAPYWSASPKAGDSAGAWAVDFNSGAVVAQAKSVANRVRLVRGR